jgi:hypothetical protein
MKHYNPLSLKDRERQEAIEKFLSGEDLAPQEHHH